MIINEPRLDYLRLTTFDRQEFNQLDTLTRSLFHNEEPTPGKWAQYQGDWFAHAFLGQGEQTGYAHWFWQCSGEATEALGMTAAQKVNVESVKCTRLDVQVTIPLPKIYSARGHADMLEVAMWPNRKRKIHLRENLGEEFNTVYIGARTSDRFARLYVKEAGGDCPLVLRFEIELKGEYSRLAWRSIVLGAATPHSILRAEFDRLPILETDAWLALERAMPLDGMPIESPKNVPEPHRTLRWLIGQVGPALTRMLNDHEYGNRTYWWLKDLLEEHERRTEEQAA